MQLVTLLKLSAFPRGKNETVLDAYWTLNFKECEVEEKMYKEPKRMHRMKTQWCPESRERKSFR